MHLFLRLFSTPVTRWPGRVLLILLVMIAALATFLPSLSLEVDLTEFKSDSSDAGAAMDVVQEHFIDTSSVVQVVVDAGPDGDVLSPDGLAALQRVDDIIVEAIGERLRKREDGTPQLRSISAALTEFAGERDVPLPSIEAESQQLIAELFARRPELVQLTSADRDIAGGTVRAAATIVLLDPAIDHHQREVASERLQGTIDSDNSPELSGFETMVVSASLFEVSVQQSTREEAPILFGTALIVILGILGLMYRSVLDTLIALGGVLLTIIGTFGFAAILGPEHLGITGPLSQLAILIPVLVVGLGVDFAVHLTTRYREERAAGNEPKLATWRSIHTVGAALVLASAATVVGFGANAFAPLQITADFALNIAVGILVAFLVMGFGVPSARLLLDRAVPSRVPHAGRSKRNRVLHLPVRLARNWPLAGAGLALVLVVASFIAATELEISFDRDDFVPSGSRAEIVRDRQAEIFGGQLDEVTYVVVEGDLTDPALLNEMLEAERSSASLDHVASVDGNPQSRSIASVAAAIARGDGPVRLPDGIAPEVIGWTGAGFSEDADLERLYSLAREEAGVAEVDLLLTTDRSRALIQLQTTAGDAGAGELRAELRTIFERVAETGATVLITSESMIMSEMSDELAGFQLQSLGMTLAIVLAILATYYGITHRRIGLGIIALIPAIVSASLLLGVMWVLGIAVNAVTATMTAIAVGIGVPYGVHVVNRFAEEQASGAESREAATTTVHETGRAIAGSGLTTFGAFVVLSFASLGPVQQLGILGAFGIMFALLASLFVMPGVLVYWEQRGPG